MKEEFKKIYVESILTMLNLLQTSKDLTNIEKGLGESANKLYDVVVEMILNPDSTKAKDNKINSSNKDDKKNQKLN